MHARLTVAPRAVLPLLLHNSAVTAALQRAAHPGRALHASFERTREAARAAVRAPSSGSRWLSSAQRC